MTNDVKPGRVGIEGDCVCRAGCLSPMACASWGYCRERHFLDENDPLFKPIPPVKR